MSKITRYSGNVVPFANNAQAGELFDFGSQSDQNTDLDSLVNASYLRGWGVVGASAFPPLEWFNAQAFTSGQFISYLHQMGVPEWNALQEYPTAGAQVVHSGSAWTRGDDWVMGDEPGVADSTRWSKGISASDLGSAAYLSESDVYNASNLNAGEIPDAQIPVLLKTSYANERGKLSDPNNNAKNHFYQRNSGNSPLNNGWISAAFGDAAGNRVVIGQYDGLGVIASHVFNLSGAAPLWIQPRSPGEIWIGPTKATPWHSTNLTKATNLTIALGTNDDSFITPKALKDAGVTDLVDSQFGVGQRWQNLTAVRAKNTEYTNTTEKAIVVSVMTSNTTINYVTGFDINGEEVKRYWEAGPDQEHEIIVPPGAKYTYVSPDGVVQRWWEFTV